MDVITMKKYSEKQLRAIRANYARIARNKDSLKHIFIF